MQLRSRRATVVSALQSTDELSVSDPKHCNLILIRSDREYALWDAVARHDRKLWDKPHSDGVVSGFRARGLARGQNNFRTRCRTAGHCDTVVLPCRGRARTPSHEQCFAAYWMALDRVSPRSLELISELLNCIPVERLARTEKGSPTTV